MIKKVIIMLIIAVIAVIGGIVYYQYLSPEREVAFSNDCNQLISQINNLVEEANYCSVDSDCLVSTETTKFCGCWSLINKGASLSEIIKGNEKYAQLSCPVVMCGECMTFPQQGDVECQNNKCVDVRIDR